LVAIFGFSLANLLTG